MNLFGYNIQRKDNTKPQNKELVFKNAISDADDINITVPKFKKDNALSELGLRNVPFFQYNSDAERIQTYRKMFQTNVHVNMAVTELKNESFVFNDIHKKAFVLDFYNDTSVDKKVQEAIQKEVSNLYNVIDFKSNATEWFQDWYVDSKFVIHVIIDESKPKDGILGVIQLDPLKIRKVKLMPRSDQNGVIDINQVEEVYIYKNDFITMDMEQTIYLERDNTARHDVVMSKDSVIMVNSGIRDMNTQKTIGYLEKAIIPYNNLKMLEESMIIFRIVRAPMRRAFYIDVSNLQPKKGEEYIRATRDRFKVNMNYNSETGAVTGNRHIQSILEDYYIPRQGNKTTEIQTLDGQNTQDMMEELEYARDQLWLALNVPRSRFRDDAQSLFTRPTEIQRDEWRMSVFKNKVREKFMEFFDSLLKTQLLLKGIIKEYEWDNIKGSYYYEFTEDNMFVKYRNAERLANQLEQLQTIEQFRGTYFSKEWIQRNVLEMNDYDVEKMEQEIKHDKDMEYQLSQELENAEISQN